MTEQTEVEQEQEVTCNCCNKVLTPQNWYRAYGANFCQDCFEDCTG